MRSFVFLAAAALGFLITSVEGAGATTVSFNLELRERLPAENAGARHVYLCQGCTPAQFAAIPLPGPNWEKNATATSARLFLPDSETNVPPVLDPSAPPELDLIPEIPGPDPFLIAKVLSVTLLGFDPITRSVVAEAQVARGTTMQWDAGRVLHRIVSPTGVEYVMFWIDQAYAQGFDIDAVGGMTGVPLLAGWTYTSELLTSPFVLTTPTGVASVLVPGGGPSTWQKITVPEPAITSLALVGGLAAARRRARTSAPSVGTRPRSLC